MTYKLSMLRENFGIPWFVMTALVGNQLELMLSHADIGMLMNTSGVVNKEQGDCASSYRGDNYVR